MRSRYAVATLICVIAGCSLWTAAGISPAFGTSTPPPAQANTTSGRKLYEAHCIACHGNGIGNHGGMYPGLDGADAVVARDPRAMLSIIKNGRGVMPAWKDRLSTAQIAAVASYVRSAWGNRQSAVTTAQVLQAK